MISVNLSSRSPGRGTSQRNKSGSLLVLLALGVLLSVFLIGVLGLDIAHNCTSRTSLQNATDAAALAGAATIVQESINPTGFQSWNYPDLQYSVSSADVSTNALARAATNFADGHAVSQDGGVGLNVCYTANNNTGSGVPVNNGACQVTGDMSIRNMFAGILGHPSDPVTTSSTATAYTTLVGVNPNVSFPIAVSLDTINGHDGSEGNFPLNESKIGDTITFSLEDPCANAAWTSYNTSSITGSGAALATAATNYVNLALATVTGSAYNPATVPSQFVNENSSTGGTEKNGGIDVWGALSGAGTSNLDKAMVGSTIVLPVVGGDLPFWNLDKNDEGTNYAPQARQTRPLIGFCAVKVTQAKWDSANNCLKSFSGKLVKALVKGTPGVINPLINPGGTSINDTNLKALDNLSPGMVQLGLTNSNQQPPSAQLALDSWYQGYTPPGNTTVSEDIGSSTIIKPIKSAFLTFMATDMDGICGGVTFNEGINYSSPPNVTGAIKVKVSPNLNTQPYDQILVDPKQTLTITSHYDDEVGLNLGNDINGDWSLGAADAGNAPMFEVLDDSLHVVQSWQKISVGGCKSGSWPFTMNLDPNKIGFGEHLVVIHAFDTDLGHGGISDEPGHVGPQHGAPGTPPSDYRGTVWHAIHGKNVWMGDAAFFYLDIQYPTCDLNN